MKRKLERMLVFMFSFLILNYIIGSVVYAEEVPDIYGEYGVSIEATTGEVLYNKGAFEEAYPASLTKVLTAMLLVENVEEGELMEVSENASGQTSSNPYFKLQPGEKIDRESALMALMVISANDVATTIAEHIAGSEEVFSEMMNEKVEEIGIESTNFVTPSGLHDPNHYSTAYDIAILTKEAMNYPEVMNAMGTKQTTIEVHESEEGRVRTVEIENPSKIHENPIALGGKTGYTSHAQNTLVEILEEDGKQVITVVMKTTLEEEYNDIDIMTKHAFSKLNKKNFLDKNEVVAIEESNGEEVEIVASEGFELYISDDGEEKIEKEVNVHLKEEVKEGETVGEVKFFYGDNEIEAIALISTKTVEMKVENTNFLFWIGIILPVPFYIGYTIYSNQQKRKMIRERRRNQ